MHDRRSAKTQTSYLPSFPILARPVRTSVDIGASAKLELVDKFCYLGDMLSVDGDAEAYHCLPISTCL